MKRISTFKNAGVNRQAGFTGVELAGVLLVISLLAALSAGAIIVYIQQGQGRAVGEALAKSMQKTKVRLGPDYTTVSLTGIISTGAFDNIKVFTVAATRDAVSHKLGGGGVITVAPANTNTTAAFTIPGVPLYSCEDLVQSIDAGSDSIVVGTTTVKASGAPGANLNAINCALVGGNTIVAQAK